MNCDPASLMEAAKCYRCIPTPLQRAVQTYLLCQWANSTAERFSYAPDTAILQWNDSGGAKSGDLATFYSSADIPTVTFIHWALGTALTSISNPDLLPSLTFVNLPSLTSPALTVADFSNCTSLQGLIGDQGVLQTLNVTGCVSLTTLNCSINPNLTAITGIGTCTAMSVLICDDCDLTGTLDLTGLSNLTQLDCSVNPNLTTLTLTGCTALTTLDCSFCNITGTLNVSPCAPALTTLNCHHNPLMTGLNVTGCTTLDYLDASFSDLPSVTGLATCAAIDSLILNDNSWVGKLDLTTLTLITTVDIWNNAGLSEIDMTGCTLLADIEAQDCPLLTTLTGTAAITNINGSLLFSNDVGLTTVSFPNLTLCGTFLFDGCSNLTSAFFGTVNIFDIGSQVWFQNCALDVASIDHILARGVASADTTEDFQLSGGTNAQPTNCTDVNLLRGFGSVVVVNGPC